MSVDLALPDGALVGRPGPQRVDAIVAAPAEAPLAVDGGVVVAEYDVDEVVYWDDGVPGPAIKMIAFSRPLAGLDHAAFHRDYTAHAALARVHHPGMHKYSQRWVRAVRGAPDDECAVIADLYFADERTYRERFYRDATSKGIVLADVDRYLDRRAAWSIAARELS